MKQHKPPASADVVITQHSVGTGLNRHNYVHKMHKLLEIEEIKRAQIIARFASSLIVTLLNKDGRVNITPSSFVRTKLVFTMEMNQSNP